MRFKVTGTYKRNGKHVIALLDANSLEEATELGEDKGINVQKVEPEGAASERKQRPGKQRKGGAKPPPPPPEAAGTTERDRDSESPRDEGIFEPAGSEEGDAVDVLSDDDSMDNLAAALGDFDTEASEGSSGGSRTARSSRSRKGKRRRRPPRGEPIAEPDDEGDAKGGSASGKQVALIAVLALVIVGGGVGGYLAFTGTGNGEPVAVADEQGTDPSEAHGEDVDATAQAPADDDLPDWLAPYATLMPAGTAMLMHLDVETVRNSALFEWLATQTEEDEPHDDLPELIQSLEGVRSLVVFGAPPEGNDSVQLKEEHMLLAITALDREAAERIERDLAESFAEGEAPAMQGGPQMNDDQWGAPEDNGPTLQFDPDEAPELHTRIVGESIVIGAASEAELDATAERYERGERGQLSDAILELLEETAQRHFVFVFDSQDGRIRLDEADDDAAASDIARIAISALIDESIELSGRLTFGDADKAQELREVLAAGGPALTASLPRSLPAFAAEGDDTVVRFNLELAPQHLEEEIEQNPMVMLAIMGMAMELMGADEQDMMQPPQPQDDPGWDDDDAWDQEQSWEPENGDWPDAPDDSQFDDDDWDADFEDFEEPDFES